MSHNKHCEHILPIVLGENESVRRYTSKEEFKKYVHQEIDNFSAKESFAEIL